MMFTRLFAILKRLSWGVRLLHYFSHAPARTLMIQGVSFIIFLFTSGLAWSSFDIVNPGTRGVYITLGKTDRKSLSEGFHWKLPFISDVVKIDVRQVVFDQQAEASSKDLQTVYTGIAVNYHPNPTLIWKLFLEVGRAPSMWENVLLRPAIQEVTKAVTAKFTAEELITKREQTKQQITKEIIRRLEKENIVVSEVSITDFKFNKPFNDAIESKQIAEQRAKQAENELIQVEIEAQQVIVKASADKQAAIHIAEGKARQIELLTEAEATFHKTLAEVVTPSSLRLRFIERWDGKMPKVMGGKGGMELSIPPSVLDADSLPRSKGADATDPPG